MADNIKVNPATEVTAVDVATDDIGGTHYPIYKMAYGAADSATLVDGVNRLPISTVIDTDNAAGDAFGRLRTSETGQRLDVEFIYDKQVEFFDEVTNGASASVTHNANSRDLTLAVGTATDGEFTQMSSHPIPYTPGNSQLIELTGTLDNAAIGGGVAQVFLRSKVTGTVTEEVIDQSGWTNATSGVDWTDSHIFQIDFQSLKVGRIRFALVAGGMSVMVASILNDNLRNTGFWQQASLPAYYRIYNDALYTYMEFGYGNTDNAVGFRYRIAANATATMRAICCTVKSESGIHLQDMIGLPRSADNGVTPVTVGATLTPILSIRSAATFRSFDNLVLSIIQSFSIQTDNPIRMAIINNGTLTGDVWAAVPDSAIEFDVTSTAITGGNSVLSSYIATSRNRESSSGGVLGKTPLWSRKGSQTGIVTIAAVKTTGSNADCLASVHWDEIR